MISVPLRFSPATVLPNLKELEPSSLKDLAALATATPDANVCIFSNSRVTIFHADTCSPKGSKYRSHFGSRYANVTWPEAHRPAFLDFILNQAITKRNKWRYCSVSSRRQILVLCPGATTASPAHTRTELSQFFSGDPVAALFGTSAIPRGCWLFNS